MNQWFDEDIVELLGVGLVVYIRELDKIDVWEVWKQWRVYKTGTTVCQSDQSLEKVQ